MRRCLTKVALLGSVAVVLSACSSSTDAPTASDKLLVATTVSPITSIASSIGGDKVSVEGIVPEGTNSHTYEPAPQVAELLSKADVIFVNGLKLEDPTAELARENMKQGADLIEIGSATLPESEYIYDYSFPKNEGKPNPHLWTDPLFANKYAAVIRDELTKRDPKNAAYYEANYKEFDTQATALADALRADQKTVPAGKLKLLTYHDAYAYFAKDFGWTIIGAVQPKNFSDPTPAEVADLIEQVKRQKVPAIFGSEVFPSSVLEEIGRATGARYEESLRDDDLPGTPGEADHSWIGLMKYDYMTMIKGLGGTTTNLDALNTVPSTPDTAVYPQ
ncbi:MAG: metal ABC transporter substrate-binding protein [Actinomycetota bacterium]|nr:metal ABC transporter substrate-binding protein [Actinomycetota bacterium]